MVSFQAGQRIVLVNVSRGGVVDEQALLDPLRTGQMGGAAVDVFDTEPPPADHPVFSLPNVVLSTHRAGRTREATEQQGERAVRRVLELLRESVDQRRRERGPALTCRMTL